MPRLIFLILLSVVLTACQRPPMVLPTMFEAGQVAPLADTPDAWRSHEHRLFFVTDRQFDPTAGDFGNYTHQRSDTMELGHLQINLGEQDAWQQLNIATQAKPNGKRPRPSIASLHRHGDLRWDPAGQPATPPYTSPRSPDALPERRFVHHLDKALKQSHGKEITIYLHGFRNSFEEAALTAAELSLYNAGLGPVILYSWPSYDSLFEYSHDRDSVRYTTAHARRFVEFLADEINAGHLNANKINFIAHSTGAEVAGSVVRELGLMSHGQSPQARQARWKIGTILLVAPDISTDVARERVLKEDLRGMVDQIVVYSSARDRALRWASRVLYRTSRIGSIHEEDLTDADKYWLRKASNVTLINVDLQHNGDPVSHSHHRFSGAALSDMLLCLRSDLSPTDRGLVRDEDEIIWHFADDYKQRVTQAAVKVYGKAPDTERP